MARHPTHLLPAYHAHVYFGPETVEQAAALVAQAQALFGVPVGRMHQRPVGPHPQWSCQITFDRSQYETIVPWLDAQRGGLDILIHGVSGDDLADHTVHASWLGREWPLSLAMFQRPQSPAKGGRDDEGVGAQSFLP